MSPPVLSCILNSFSSTACEAWVCGTVLVQCLQLAFLQHHHNSHHARSGMGGLFPGMRLRYCKIMIVLFFVCFRVERLRQVK